MIRKLIRELILEGINSNLKATLSSTQRIILLPRELDISKAGPFRQPDPRNPALKPSGLWYSFGDAWADFAKDAPGLIEKYQESEYVYEILGVQTTTLDKPNPNKVLVLNTREDSRTFVEKYDIKLVSRYVFAPWYQIARDFGGIEIPTHEALDSYFGGWDVVSGCIWNLKAIQAKQLQGPAVVSKRLDATHERFADDVGEWLYDTDREWMEDLLLEGDYDFGEGIEDAENIYEAVATLMERNGVGVYEVADSIKSVMLSTWRTDARYMRAYDRLMYYLHLKTGWSPVSWGTHLGNDSRLISRFKEDHPNDDPEDILDQIFESVLKWYDDPKQYRLNGNNAFELEKSNY